MTHYNTSNDIDEPVENHLAFRIAYHLSRRLPTIARLALAVDLTVFVFAIVTGKPVLAVVTGVFAATDLAVIIVRRKRRKEPHDH